VLILVFLPYILAIGAIAAIIGVGALVIFWGLADPKGLISIITALAVVYAVVQFVMMLMRWDTSRRADKKAEEQRSKFRYDGAHQPGKDVEN